jgi:hypothetical protein
MEFASLDDAFPNHGGSTKPKRSKKKEGFYDGAIPETDADRPAVKRMMEVPPMSNVMANSTDGLDDLLDESTKFAARYPVNKALPKPRASTELETAQMPSYFGAEPFTNPSEDTFASYTTARTPHGYMLEADFTKTFDEKGYDKATGNALPVPELRNRWKLMSSDKMESAVVAPKKTSQNQFSGMDTSEFRHMKSKIDELMARLDDLENRSSGANPQLEVMTFIMTGLFLMFVVDVAVRKSGTMRMVNVR